MIFQKGYTPSYIAAAIANCAFRSEDVRRKFSGASLNDIQKLLHKEYGVTFDDWDEKSNLDIEWVSAGVELLIGVDCAQINEDIFAGTHYSFDWDECQTHLANEADNPDSIAHMVVNSSASWITRALEGMIKNREVSKKGLTLGQANSVAPASNRIVLLSDNNPESEEIFSDIEKIIRDYKADNEAGHDDQQQAVIADLEAGRTLWEKGTFFLKSLWETLLKSLEYISAKFADKAIGELASKLLKVITTFLESGS